MIPDNITIAESGVQDGIIWKLTTKGELILTGKYTGAKAGDELSFENFQWKAYMNQIYTAYVDVENLSSLQDMFREFTALKRVSFGTNMNKGTVVTMRSAFNSATSLTSMDSTNLNTENVTNMFRAFSGCSSLQKLDLSGFDTKNVTDMSWMFAEDTKLKEVNLQKFDTSGVPNMANMFLDCKNMKSIRVGSNWDMTRVNAEGKAFFMFSGCGVSNVTI